MEHASSDMSGAASLTQQHQLILSVLDLLFADQEIVHYNHDA